MTQILQNDILMTNAKRLKKIQIYIRSHRLNPMGRTKSFFAVLQIAGFKTLSPTICKVAQISSQDISSRRSFSCPYICYSRGYWANREYPITNTQWIYPAGFRLVRISTSGHIKNFSMEIQRTKPSKSSTNSRQISVRNIQTSRTPLFCYHRCGYDSNDCIRTPGIRQKRRQQYSLASQTISTTGFVFQDSKSSFKGQTSDLSQFANILYYQSDDMYQKNNVYSRFSGRFEIKIC